MMYICKKGNYCSRTAEREEPFVIIAHESRKSEAGGGAGGGAAYVDVLNACDVDFDDIA